MSLMNFDERLTYLLLGCLIGFLCGYFARSLKDIKEKVDEVDEIVKKNAKNDKGEGGFMRLPIVQDIAILTVVLVTVWAAFVSNAAAKDVREAQDNEKQTTRCTVEYLDATIAALNERTTYSGAQAQANIELQRTQADFLRDALREPPLEEQRVVAGLTRYFENVQSYLDIVMKTVDKQSTNPYPTSEDFLSCVEK